MLSPPELLSPAGDWECARAAVANGADAIYFGLATFNARMRAGNFTEDDLPGLMGFLHEHGRRGYLTLNVLVFQDELTEAERLLRLAADAGVDALLVQDLGLVRLARAVAPGLAVHASTQMTITSPEGVHFARALGIERVVLARELSLREIARFRADDPEMLPLETFVHGALCVAYSGQCLTSESLGQRSANRGECAQACRLPYDLIVDGEVRDLGQRRYLLSPQDLAAVDDVPALIDSGVQSFKIEGRLKTPEYVAAVTQVYRRAIDKALSARASFAVPEGDRYLLELAFSRGLFSGWLHGVDHQRLVHARFGTKRGALAGTVTRVGADYVELTPRVPLAPGDGVVFETGINPDQEQGGRIYRIEGERVYFQRGKLDFRRLAPGHKLWKNSDPALDHQLRKTFAGELPRPARPVRFALRGRAGKPLVLDVSAGAISASVESSVPLERAQQRALTRAVFEQQLGRLGGTGFELAGLDLAVTGAVFLPLRELNELRRRGLAALEEALARGGSAVERAAVEGAAVEGGADAAGSGEAAPSGAAAMIEGIAARRAASRPVELALSVLCRSLEQLDVALTAGVSRIYVDFEDIRRYPDAVARARATPGAQLFLATPRIQKAGEQAFFKQIERAEPDGVLIRNLGGLAHFRASPLRKAGDFSLNVSNALSAELLIDSGLEYLTISYDLNHAQVQALLASAPPEWFELTLHQHMPLFHMEHCVFAAFLSKGHTHLDCGRPCEHHKVALRDRVGACHPIQVDVGCRNTVYHQKAQTGARYLQAFTGVGLGKVRVELVDEDAPRAEALITAYQQLLGGTLTPRELSARLQITNQLGVTGGTLTVVA
ncbi:MAG TPA: DUF3656 domain-containing protein [Polyangiaceae bacterium]|nr:DUF3656 domain-containing protein [Polyangiaceae bacterium]